MKGKLQVFFDDGDTKYVKAQVGKRKKTFHRLAFATPEELSKALAVWCQQAGVTDMVSQEVPMSAQQQIKEHVAVNLLFRDIVGDLADAAEGLEKWDDFDTHWLANIARCNPVPRGSGPIHLSYVEGIFEKIRGAFTPMVFCELARAEDRPEAFCSDPTFLTPVNDGLNRIMDAIYGNTRDERMKTIHLRDD